MKSNLAQGAPKIQEVKVKSKLQELLEIKRAEYRKSLQQNSQITDTYAQSVKVDFIAVLNRHFHKLGDAA